MSMRNDQDVPQGEAALASSSRSGSEVGPEWVKSRFIIEGMTCSSCVGALEECLAPVTNSAIRSANVTLFPAVANIIHDSSTLTTEVLKEIIEDRGYGAELYESIPILDLKGPPLAVRSDLSSTNDQVLQDDVTRKIPVDRKVKVQIEGLGDPQDCARINEALSSLKDDYSESSFTFTPITHMSSMTTLSYCPIPVKGLTLRKAKARIEDLGFRFSVVHEESLEARGRQSHKKESAQILIRFGASFLFAIPTFIIAVLGMSLLSESHRFRQFWDTPIWGGASRGTVALFILATPVQFGIGSYFYIRAWKGLSGVWRKNRGNRKNAWTKIWFNRLVRWGSMDSLVVLGTTLAYFASLAYMILDITHPNGLSGGTPTYFDTSVFLMFFILAGRYLDVTAKTKTGEAITELGQLRPTSGILHSDQGHESDEGGEKSGGRIEVVDVDFIEVGDILLVPVGSSPPLDCILTESSPQTSFDESSLTGESRPLVKSPGDQVFSGTVNTGPSAAIVEVQNGQGASIIDSIIRSVQDAMGRKAGLEKLADQVTAYFVPCIVALACITFIVWLLTGYLGALPEQWLGGQQTSSWALFAIQFGIAVLLAACPCGIGLAAPAAQMVGMGLAAKQGILVRGVEAFQTFRKVSTVVFDKTGTLTTSHFRVSDVELLGPKPGLHKDFSTFWEILMTVEESSTHPISIGLQQFCAERLSTMDGCRAVKLKLLSCEEIPGRGLAAVVHVDSSIKVEIIVGNALLIEEKHGAYLDNSTQDKVDNILSRWQEQGKSIVLVAARIISVHEDVHENPLVEFISTELQVMAAFALHDPPRPEAAFVIEHLGKLGIECFMITGDNEKTARAIASLIGIASDKVIAGVLPVGKRDWIEKLQTPKSELAPSKLWWSRFRTNKDRPSSVAFVGDGINDAPAIAQADAGIAMGTGSTVAISTSDFCLLSSSLVGLLTLHSLAHATIRKIMTNFFWACLYNVCLIPLAAGAFYAIGDKQTRLPPVWASLAMALSSISVMVNSLLLRWLYRPPKAVREWKGKEGLFV